MKKCFATVPLTNLLKTNHYARKNNCSQCDDKYNCICASSAQLKVTKKWVKQLIEDVKQDVLASIVLNAIHKNGLNDICQLNPMIKDYILSMVKDDYFYHLANVEIIKESLLKMGIDIEQEFKIEENNDG